MTNESAQPVRGRFFGFGTIVLLVLVAVGLSFGLARFIAGIGAVTNLNDHYPWGIWIAVDVACGVALAAGGFTTAAIVEIFGRHRYEPLLRPAVLTAWLGYAMVAVSLTFDLGRYWNIWQPIFNWQGNSVLFEVGMCVMAYLTVLTIEMLPVFLQGVEAHAEDGSWTHGLKLAILRGARAIRPFVRILLPFAIVAGVVLSFMHQSSLGTLMVIAPSKLNALWYTPILPLLFLTSAIMVGPAMVIIEAMWVSRGLGRRMETPLLAAFARVLPALIGLYGLLKLADLLVRWDQLSWTTDPQASISLVVEVTVGLLLPLFILVRRELRERGILLFAAAACVVFGVVLNRINVFLVGYNPPFDVAGYFPSIGEIALTVGLISLIALLYRTVAHFLPVLSAEPQPTSRRYPHSLAPKRHLSPTTVNVIRASAAGALLAFVGFYVFVHDEAIAGAQTSYRKVVREDAPTRQRLADDEGGSHPRRPMAYRDTYLLDRQDVYQGQDFFEPVLFNHRAHDNFTRGDCGRCHHRFTYDEEDRIGSDMVEFHLDMDIRLGGSCVTCHDDMEDNAPQSCSQCHARANEPDDPARSGLKGAYHRQCIGCHEEQPPAAHAPVDCVTCHHPRVPDHRLFMAGESFADREAVTARCRDCHQETLADVAKSAHWRRGGWSAHIADHETQALSVRNLADNYCVVVEPGNAPCSIPHVCVDGSDHVHDSTEVHKIDCLVCHDTTGRYRADPTRGTEAADPEVLYESAISVGRPSRARCGGCHFAAGGNTNAKHGDLEPLWIEPAPEQDVHMGGHDMLCQDCHLVQNHQVAGRSLWAPAFEGKVGCEQCHGNVPHGISGVLSRHLDDHVRSVACETCHVPQLAVVSSTRVRTDYEAMMAGDRDDAMEQAGMLVPEYHWYDGTHQALAWGDELGDGRINAPLGERRDPAARIYPFKVHRARVPVDADSERIAQIAHPGEGATEDAWLEAARRAFAALGHELSGELAYEDTTMYTSIHHGVVPAAGALGCADCHEAEAIQCARCHESAAGLQQPEHTEPTYPQQTPRLDFGALGYEGDPALTGGRFIFHFGRGQPR